jgi:hypothetical protein
LSARVVGRDWCPRASVCILTELIDLSVINIVFMHFFTLFLFCPFLLTMTSLIIIPQHSYTHYTILLLVYIYYSLLYTFVPPLIYYLHPPPYYYHALCSQNLWVRTNQPWLTPLEIVKTKP